MYPAMEVEVLAFHDKSTVCWMVLPEPLAVSDAELEVLMKNESVAEALPLVLGAKLTVKGITCPAATVTGRVRLPIAKAELLELAEDNVTLAPLAVKLPL